MSPSAYCEAKGSKCDCPMNQPEAFKNRSTTTKSHESSNKEEGGGFNFLENLHIFGGAVSQNICKDGDTSWYCGLSRVYSAVFMIIALIVVLFVLLYLFRTFILPLLNYLNYPGFRKNIKSKSSSGKK